MLDILLTLSTDITVHRAGSQLKINIKVAGSKQQILKIMMMIVMIQKLVWRFVKLLGCASTTVVQVGSVA